MVSMMVSSPFTPQEATRLVSGLYSSFRRAAARRPSARYFGSLVAVVAQHRGVEIQEAGIVVLLVFHSHDAGGPQLGPLFVTRVVRGWRYSFHSSPGQNAPVQK